MKTQKGHALSFAFSGRRKTGKTSLYQESELVLPNILREYDFEFLGNPFGHLPHPLEWEAQHKNYPVSRVFECWAMFNDFIRDKWEPTLNAGKIPVMDSCGLDLILYATACRDCTYEDDIHAFDVHTDNVVSLVKRRGISPPHYLIISAEEKILLRQLKRVMPNISREDAIAFVRKELHILEEYFKEGRGQHKPHWIPPNLSMDEMVANSLRYIGMRVRTREAEAA